MRRTDGIDADAALAASDSAPADVEAAKTAADLELLTGTRAQRSLVLLRSCASPKGDERQAAREHLVSLFELVGNHDPEVAARARNWQTHCSSHGNPSTPR